MSLRQRIHWTNTIWLTSTALIAVIGTTLMGIYGLIQWPTVILALVLTVVSGLSITAGYHRLFAHKSYQASPIVRWFFMVFGSSLFEGSVLEWCTDHRNHHRYTDQDKDPYSINKGFWYAHIGWVLLLDENKRDFSNVEDLSADPALRFQHRYFKYFAILTGIALPVAIASLWGDPLGGFVIAGILRIFLNNHFTFCINSVCHWFGKLTYSKQQSARDNWVTALFTYGEGFHNFHHQFPIDYRNGVRAYHFDPTKWLIRTLKWVGLASDLKTVSYQKIVRYQVAMDKEQLSESEYQVSQVKALHEKILQAIERIESLEKDYERLKKVYRQKLIDKMHLDKLEDLKVYRDRLKSARNELKQFLAHWTSLVRYTSA